MQATLTINGTAFHPWAREGGIEQSPVVRQEREIVTLDGTKYSTSILKRAITFSAVELRSNTLVTLISALQTNPAEVVYTEMATGESRTSIFYVTEIQAAEKVVVGGNTYFEGFGFTLEER